MEVKKNAFAKDNLLEWKSLSAGEYMNRVKIDLHFTLINLVTLLLIDIIYYAITIGYFLNCKVGQMNMYYSTFSESYSH